MNDGVEMFTSDEDDGDANGHDSEDGSDDGKVSRDDDGIVAVIIRDDVI